MLSKKRFNIRAYNADRVFVPRDLAVTPSEMYALSKQGIPIGTHMVNPDAFNDGEELLSHQCPDTPFMLRRGVELSDVAMYQNQCRKKVREVSVK